MIVRYMPFWFIDVIKTEEKLSKYSEEGIKLKKFSPSGKFGFEESSSDGLRYRIVRSKKCGGEVPARLLEKGWEKVGGSRNYYVAATDKKISENAPSYKTWITFYRLFQSILFFIICFALGIFCGAGAAALENIGDIGYRWAIIIPAFALSLLMIILFIRVHKSNRKILSQSKDSVKFDFTIPDENFIYTPEQEKAMLKSKKMIKKSPSMWIAAPDKTEKWVEKMAAEGWKLYRLDKLGSSFYFVKSEPCRLKFVVDYQDEISDEYIELTRSEGWKLEFASVTRMSGYCIWSREYEENEDIPEIYTDNESALAHAKNYLVKMIIPVIFCVLIYAVILAAIISDGLKFSPFEIIFGVFALVIVLEYGYFSVKSIGYYFRLKNKTNNI